MDKCDNSVRLSAVCPTLNELQHIERLLSFFVAASPDSKELLVVDGNSTDGTQDVVKRWQEQFPSISLLDNPGRIVSHAINLAIPKCRGEIIVRLDAHTEYAADYFEQIINTFQKTGADIVGGPTRTKADGVFQQAVAHAISTRLGIGNSRVHQENYEGPTDSVTFGAWRRSVFERIGTFDAELVRNQDDEFHYRARSNGLVVYQNPDIRLFYYPRDTVASLWRQYYQYGLYKPLVIKKVPGEWKWRHVVPSLFVAYILLCPLLVWLHWVACIPLIAYAVAVLGYSTCNQLNWLSKCACLLAYPAIHVSYGCGFALGILKVWRRK